MLVRPERSTPLPLSCTHWVLGTYGEMGDVTGGGEETELDEEEEKTDICQYQTDISQYQTDISQ